MRWWDGTQWWPWKPLPESTRDLTATEQVGVRRLRLAWRVLAAAGIWTVAGLFVGIGLYYALRGLGVPEDELGVVGWVIVVPLFTAPLVAAGIAMSAYGRLPGDRLRSCRAVIWIGLAFMPIMLLLGFLGQGL